jgi:hypothetical protein
MLGHESLACLATVDHASLDMIGQACAGLCMLVLACECLCMLVHAYACLCMLVLVYILTAQPLKPASSYMCKWLHGIDTLIVVRIYNKKF